ncbi:protease modulator HflC [Lacibacterium aquatile]|uniref:Protein HflC n=1 Tax=Lacibacterium aquatile TaxID=1168082 RepID=A0ABW5DLZ9_9PROT
MNSQRLLIGGAVAVVALLVVAANTFFTVRETQQVIVTQFGAPVGDAISTPGLHIKVPFMQDVRVYSRQLLEVDPAAQEVLLVDQKRLVVDAYARYRIVVPLKYYQTVANEAGAQGNIAPIINTSIRRVLGGNTQAALLSSDRTRIMEEIQREVSDRTAAYGIEIVDVRLRRADLPDQTSAAVFNRMKAERDREARELRAQGQELYQQIRSRADRDRTVLIAEAQRESQTIRGEGDGKSIQIYADAFNKDVEFYGFYRSLQAYRQSLGNDTTLVLSPNSEFFRYFGGKLSGQP